MADADHHMFTKSVLYTPPLIEKKTAREFQEAIVLMLISLNQCQNGCDDEKEIQI